MAELKTPVSVPLLPSVVAIVDRLAYIDSKSRAEYIRDLVNVDIAKRKKKGDVNF